jgi:sulfofructose kinase
VSSLRARPRPEVICVGAANLDTIALVDGDVVADGRVIADEIVEAGGGPAATAAVALARLGVPVGFCGVVGADDAGKRVVELLESEGVDCSWVRVDPALATARSVVLVNRESGARSIITRPAPKPRAEDIPLDVPWLHVDHSGWAPVHAALAAARSSAKLSLDGGNPIPGLTLDRVDLYAPTVLALSDRYPGESVDSALTLAASEGPELVVATDGAAGTRVLDATGARVIPSFRVDVVSTLGAGDVFHGALLAGVVLGRGTDEAVRFASAVAALSCLAVDGRSGIPTLEAATSFMNQQLETL